MSIAELKAPRVCFSRNQQTVQRDEALWWVKSTRAYFSYSWTFSIASLLPAIIRTAGVNGRGRRAADASFGGQNTNTLIPGKSY